MYRPSRIGQSWGSRLLWVMPCKIMEPKETIRLKLKENSVHSFIHPFKYLAAALC